MDNARGARAAVGPGSHQAKRLRSGRTLAPGLLPAPRAVQVITILSVPIGKCTEGAIYCTDPQVDLSWQSSDLYRIGTASAGMMKHLD